LAIPPFEQKGGEVAASGCDAALTGRFGHIFGSGRVSWHAHAIPQSTGEIGAGQELADLTCLLEEVGAARLVQYQPFTAREQHLTQHGAANLVAPFAGAFEEGESSRGAVGCTLQQQQEGALRHASGGVIAEAALLGQRHGAFWIRLEEYLRERTASCGLAVLAVLLECG
jgi:hypothetical protein